MLQLSGIQHFVYCPRQWALIYLEQQWEENHLTAEGRLLHENVDNPLIRETNGSSVITLRGIKLESQRLGFVGIADAIEIRPQVDAPVKKADILKSKKYNMVPIEYKHGKRKVSDCDRVQVAAQSMTLEEMLGIEITQGAVFYWSERHREYFDIDGSLRAKVEEASARMHKMFKEKSTPTVIKNKGCLRCSIYELCIPELTSKSATHYIISHLNEEAP